MQCKILFDSCSAGASFRSALGYCSAASANVRRGLSHVSTEFSFRAVAALASLSLFACGTSSPAAACRVGADCASGICGGDGTCFVSSGGDASPNLDGATGADGQVVMNDAGIDGSNGICDPNTDDVITRAEAPVGPGLHATFAVARSVTIPTTAGVMNPDGSRTWDYSGALTGDHTLVIDTAAPGGQSFSSSFPSATYTARLSDSATFLGVFQTTPSSLLLLGVVSPDSPDAGPQTKITYATPIITLAFPLQKDATWTTTSNASGTAQGTSVFYTESYSSKVDATGSLKTPFGTFHVLRVNVVRTSTSLPAIRSFVFMTDCFTTVARIVSNDFEASPEFTTAAEIQRLSP